jgi:hypothetical protein
MLETMPQFQLPEHHPLREGDRLRIWGEIYNVLKIDERNIATVDKVLEQCVIPRIYILRKPFWYWSRQWKIRKWWLRLLEKKIMTNFCHWIRLLIIDLKILKRRRAIARLEYRLDRMESKRILCETEIIDGYK